MKVYTVLEAPDGAPDRVSFVPEGFAYMAFVFTWLWALWHRMWVIGLLLFAFAAALAVMVENEMLGPGLAGLLWLATGVIFSFEARNLKVKSLERSGYRRAGLIQASNLEAAELTYFAARLPAGPAPEAAPAPTRLRAGPDDTLGIFGNV